MPRYIDVPVLARVAVYVEDDSLSEKEAIEKAIRAANCIRMTVDDKDIDEEVGDGCYVDDYIEYEAYEQICQGNFYYGHISEVNVSEGEY